MLGIGFRRVSLRLALGLSLAIALFEDVRASGAMQTPLERLLGERSVSVGGTPIDWQRVEAFYQKRGNRLAWIVRSSREDVLKVMEHSEDEGLSPEDYRVGILRAERDTSAEAAARYDITLTDSILRYAHDVRLGRVKAADVDTDVDLPTQRFDPVAEISPAMASGHLAEFLESLPPGNPQYAALRSALARYRVMASVEPWPTVPAGKPIRFDANDDPRLSVLADRLRAEGDASANESDAAALRESVVNFQRSHGLGTDGVVGPATIRALNVSAADRVAQIEANMERWRWLPRSLESRRVEINVPDATLQAWEGGAVILSSRLIIGRIDNPTPILRTVALGVTVNPPWDVPKTIARAEILPKLRRDPRYLSEHHMVLLGRDQIRQIPGPDNALGQLKLEMPNRFSVYLHDTPARTLFARTDRDLSHGCMRVEQILPLASIALTGESDKATPQLQQAIATGVTQHIALKSPLPVYVLYWTAWVDANETVQFRNDLYGRDERLIALLKGRVAGTRYAAIAGTCPPSCSS